MVSSQTSFFVHFETLNENMQIDRIASVPPAFGMKSKPKKKAIQKQINKTSLSSEFT